MTGSSPGLYFPQYQHGTDTSSQPRSVSRPHIHVHRLLSGGGRRDPKPGPRGCETPASASEEGFTAWQSPQGDTFSGPPNLFHLSEQEARQQGHSAAPPTVTNLTGRPWPRESIKHGPKTRAQGSFEAILGGRQLPKCEEWGRARPPVNFLNCHCRNLRWSTGHRPQNHGLARL